MKNRGQKEKNSNCDENAVCEEKIARKTIICDCPVSKRRLNFGGLFLGIVLIAVGLFYLARNFGWLPANATLNFFQLWPLLLVFIGLSMISARNWLMTVFGFLFTLTILTVTFLTLAGSIVFRADVSETPINIAKNPDAEILNLEIRHMFGRMAIGSGEKDFIKGTLKSDISELEVRSSEESGAQNVFLEAAWDQAWRSKLWTERIANDLVLSLDPDILTHIYVEGGASDIDLDLKNVKTDLVGIDTGAANLKLALGNKVDSQVVKVNSGASNIEITAPQESGVRIAVKSGFISKEMNGLKKITENLYESENYASAGKKIDISLNLGASSLEFSFE